MNALANPSDLIVAQILMHGQTQHVEAGLFRYGEGAFWREVLVRCVIVQWHRIVDHRVNLAFLEE